MCSLNRRVSGRLIALEMAGPPRRAGSVNLLKRNFCNIYFVLQMKKEKKKKLLYALPG